MADALVMLQMGQQEAAKEHLLKALEIVAANFPPDSPVVANQRELYSSLVSL